MVLKKGIKIFGSDMTVMKYTFILTSRTKEPCNCNIKPDQVSYCNCNQVSNVILKQYAKPDLFVSGISTETDITKELAITHGIR